MSQTYAKVINDANITGTIKTSNGVVFIQLDYQVYYNCNLVEETYDSFNNYTLLAPLSKFNWNYNIDVNSALITQVNLQFGNSTVSFNRGEYVNTTGGIWDVNEILNIMNIVLNYTS